jgi:hypothetical protein
MVVVTLQFSFRRANIANNMVWQLSYTYSLCYHHGMLAVYSPNTGLLFCMLTCDRFPIVTVLLRNKIADTCTIHVSAMWIQHHHNMYDNMHINQEALYRF